MASKPVPDAELQATMNAWTECNNNVSHAAEKLGIHRETFNARLRMCKKRGIRPGKAIENMNDIEHVKVKLKRTEAELARQRETSFDERIIREIIGTLAKRIDQTEPPAWLVSPMKAASKSPGVPTLFLSDWHFGEVVDPSQIGGVNRYNLTIGKSRAKQVIERTIDLLNNHMVNPKYPGIVCALGGDLVSGDIHEELVATNEMEIMPVVIELFGVLTWCISTLADEFGRVFLPCVGGNHGRNTHKIRAKGRNFTSFDWLLYAFLEKRFENDKRVTFLIPNGPDALYSVYNHKYLLTHGDKLGKGGDGMIGALGPILRGDHKKRSRNSQIDMVYDTLIIGHFHQLMMLERVIVNGSLKGYDEYANENSFGFEVPRQALWITHPTHGITFAMPVNAGNTVKKDIRSEWATWKK